VHGLLPLPYASSFFEVNVRTYVEHEGKPGIYFFSLDASRRLAVEAARITYRLPYFHARITAGSGEGDTVYESKRIDGRGHRAALRARYAPAADADADAPAPGSLEHFLTERYCLFTLHEGDVWAAEIHHPPWQLQQAEAEIDENTMPPPGLELAGEPLCHLSRCQDVLIWALERRGGR
jgi:uncharacterized protein